MPTYFIETFGCQMNVADSDLLAAQLLQRGFSQSSVAEDADLVVVNTCSVRDHAEKRAKARISLYASQKRTNNHRQTLWVVGCMAQRLGDSLKEAIPGVDRVIGAQKVEHLCHDLDAYLADIPDSTHGVSADGSSLSAFLTVMRGCDNFCSYCVVPFVRGRELSLAADTLEEEARRMAAQGTRELTLLGQNVNSYHDGETDFADLLYRIHAIDGIKRIRFTTSHPKDCSKKLIRTVKELPKLSTHFHLPVQSGSTKILALMNRKYTREDYLRLVDSIRTAIPDADITTDVMVGFPGESEDDYQDTMALFEQVRFTTAYMFAYSPREETAAAKMSGDVPAAKKKERLQALIALQTSITKQIYASMVGTTAEVLFTEQQSRRDKAWMGRDRGCKRVLFRCLDMNAGIILPVRIVRSTGMTLIAEGTSTCAC